ncbi:hypothetical protein R3P38DRAFT_1885089 [Favolaschia claudopus]|uniref:F-box domain-containing protein n=1 Tax=Favolaschia claudopus TaxID=2862362 RepID=A0AAW0DE83_9AGAR
MLPAQSVVAEVQDRIEQLSSTIETVKQLLHDLEEQRIQARRRLNSLRDPMARLPLELQSQIFLDVAHNRGEYVPSMSSGNVPMTFLGVCELWRGIALSTPKLWTTISMTGLPRRTVGYTTLSETWIERAQTLPLSLSLEGRLRPLDDNVQELLTRYQHQVRTLTLTVKIEDSGASSIRDEYFLDIEGRFSSLEKLTVLSKQKIYSDGVAEELLDVMRTAPGLSHCVMVNMFTTWDVPEMDPSVELLTLPSLETLELGDIDAFTYRGIQNNSASILLYLTLPALKMLRLAALDISYDDFISFFTRSSPPLESAELSLRGTWPKSLLNRVLRAMPTLQHLTLIARSKDHDRLHRFLDALTTSPDILPNLRKLVISTEPSANFDYEALLRLLNARRTSYSTPLECFELHFTSFDARSHPLAHPPSVEVESALQELREGGMKIHVGSRTKSFRLI